MKKIIATVLAMVMALALCTTAFAAIPVWTGSGATVGVDLFDGKYNTKIAEGTMEFHAAKAPTVGTDGIATAEGNVAYYTFTGTDPVSTHDGNYILVSSIPANADASNYVLVKTSDDSIDVGAVGTQGNQSSADQTLIMKKVKAVKYAYTGEVFTAWGDLCGQYKKPADVEDVTYVKYTAKTTVVCSTAAEPNDTNYLNNILVGGEVYTGVANKEAVKHAWAASAWDKKGVATEYTCATCKTVAKVINASVNAPAGSTVENIGGTLIAFTYTPGTANNTTNTGSNKSPKTFDAGIAMYVGMALTSVAGSAVVIGKKKEF